MTGRQAHPQQFLKGTATLLQDPDSAANARLQLQEEKFSIKSLWHAQPQHAALTDTNPDASGVESAYAVQAHPNVPVVDNLEDIWLVNKLQQDRKAKQKQLQDAVQPQQR